MLSHQRRLGGSLGFSSSSRAGLERVRESSRRRSLWDFLFPSEPCYLFFQPYLAGKGCEEQLERLSLGSSGWPLCQGSSVDQQRSGPMDWDEASSPLDHIGRWPGGDQGIPGHETLDRRHSYHNLRSNCYVPPPLDHIGGRPTGDRGFSLPPVHASASTSQAIGRRLIPIWNRCCF